MNKELWEIVGSGKPTVSVLKETIAISVTISIRVQNRHSQILLRVLSCGRMREMRREPEVPEEVPVVECLDGLARITSNGTCTNSFCEKWHPPECLFYKSDSDCRFGKKCSYAHRQVDEQPSERSKKNGDKSAVAMLKKNEQPQRIGRLVKNADSSNTRQLGCEFQDMSRRRLHRFYGSDIRKPIRCVKFTKAVVRHADIRDQNPSLALICPGEPHQRSPNAPKFEDRSQEETEWQEQGAHEAAWKLAKNVLKLKEHQRATFFSPSETWCLPASILKPEEREFVVDSGESMHMISKKDLSDAEMDTLTKSCSPTIVIYANGEVQTHEEATVYVKELDVFLTMKVVENTPAVLSLGKLCDENGYS